MGREGGWPWGLGCGQREHHPGHLIIPVTIGHMGSLAWDLWELEAIGHEGERSLEEGGGSSGWDLQDPRQVGFLTLLCLGHLTCGLMDVKGCEMFPKHLALSLAGPQQVAGNARSPSWKAEV